MASTQFLVFSNATDGHDDEFNTWYDQVHLPDVCAVPGVAAAQRYEIIDFTPEVPEGMDAVVPPPPPHRYLAVYDLDGEPKEVFDEFFARMADSRMTLSETLDMSTVQMSFWAPRG